MMEAFSYGFDSMLAGYQRFEDDTLVATKHFVRLGLVELQERDAANNITAEYAWNLYRPGGIGGLLTTKQGTSKYHYLYNHLGHVMAMVDGKGKRVSGYNYSPYGIVSGSDFSQQPFGYSTKRSDFTSGLVYFGYRFYMPNLGRWLNRDPLEEAGGINLYAYVNGDPMGYVDPDGQHPVIVAAAAVATGYMLYLVYDKFMDFIDAKEKTDEILDRQRKAYEDGDYSACFNELEIEYRKSFMDTAVKGANFAGSVPGTIVTGPFPTTGVDVILAGSSTVVVEAAGE